VRVLLVEDETRLAETVRRGLVAEGFVVEVEHDGVDGLAAAAAGDFDVVVLDIMLPGLSGYQWSGPLPGTPRMRENRARPLAEVDHSWRWLARISV
jgi:DNA-binding response OmpR family regulator